jgi:integrase
VKHHLPIVVKAEQVTFERAMALVITDFTINKKKSLADVQRRIDLHLTPFFKGKRMAGITRADVDAYIAKRQAETILTTKATGATRPVANGSINRELQILKRAFNLAIESGVLAAKPTIKLLKEAPARSGFLEADTLTQVIAHLPDYVQPVVQFASITGWRIPSEVLTLEWKNVDLKAGEVRLDPGRTKNGEPRLFPMTVDLRRLLEQQDRERTRLKKAGHIWPLVFFREIERQGRAAPAGRDPVVQEDVGGSVSRGRLPRSDSP